MIEGIDSLSLSCQQFILLGYLYWTMKSISSLILL